MLDSHPDLAIPPESYFVAEMAHLPGPFSWEDYVRRVGGHDRFLRWGLPVEALHEQAGAGEPKSLPDAVRCTFAAYAAARGKPRYGDKTPLYVQNVQLLAELFPEAVFVHVVRDGRDVTLSFLEREWGPKTIEEGARRWCKRVRAGRRAGAVLGRTRYLEVRYERLVADPERELGRVCTLADLTPAPEMLRYFERADSVVAGTKYPGQHTGIAAPPTPGVRDWRTEMSSEDAASFEAIAGGLLDELGYERAAPG